MLSTVTPKGHYQQKQDCKKTRSFARFTAFASADLAEPSLGAAEERPALAVCDDLVEEPHLPLSVRNQTADAKPAEEKDQDEAKAEPLVQLHQFLIIMEI